MTQKLSEKQLEKILEAANSGNRGAIAYLSSAGYYIDNGRLVKKGQKQPAQTRPTASKNALDGVTQEMIDAVKALDEPGSKQTRLGNDYLALLRVYREQNPGCSAMDAIKAVNKAVPMAREQFIEKQSAAANQQADPTVADGPTYDQEEIETYMTQIRHYMIQNKCSRLQAVKDIDVLKPGLRQAYVRYVNKKL